MCAVGKGRELKAFKSGQHLNHRGIILSPKSEILEESTAICAFLLWIKKPWHDLIRVVQCLEGQEW